MSRSIASKVIAALKPQKVPTESEWAKAFVFGITAEVFNEVARAQGWHSPYALPAGLLAGVLLEAAIPPVAANLIPALIVVFLTGTAWVLYSSHTFPVGEGWISGLSIAIVLALILGASILLGRLTRRLWPATEASIANEGLPRRSVERGRPR